ncbi:helix-turn-helix domain-containing protein [Catenulispora rubra]|uniref:helix-turn-helix domain-containing protein n=1 Tax=Catenulispora rubra TaxID=280293 RepID=UPI00189236FF|nr:TetR/AcrR family transcriptional regulator [Catenulispora rubra]
MIERADPATRGRYGPRRPRPGLTPDIVVAAGRRVIERDGLDALTMRTVAAELNTAAASLYRHVADRDALLVAILEQIASGLPVDVPGDTPQQRLRHRFVGAHDYLADCVWVLHILIRGELNAEAALPFNNACLDDFLQAGLSPSEALTAFRACWYLTVGELLDRHQHKPREDTQRERVIRDFDAQRFPALARVRDLTADERAADDFEAMVDNAIRATLAR